MLTSAPTDPTRWRLIVDEGVHQWRYLGEVDSARQPQSTAEKYFLGLPTGLPSLQTPRSFQQSACNGFRFYQNLQLNDGHWGCGYGGPSFLLAGIVIAMYITETEIPPQWKAEIIRYLSNTVNEDGGWGLHSAGASTVFATTLYYVTLRILGLEPSHSLTSKARARLHALGGAVGIPQWGKIWMALLNLYSWGGINPIPPELWLLPDWIPFHPWRWWVQCRVVYLPVSYLYANKVTMPLNPLIASLRQEIYTQAYDDIRFEKYRDTVAATDLKKPISGLLRAANMCLRFWERYIRPDCIAQWANERVYALIQREDENTSYNCLAPVNKAFHMVSVWYSDGANSSRMRRHREKIPSYMWVGEKGMTCSGTNGVQVWDTAFSIQAMVEAGTAMLPDFRPTLKHALEYLDISQLREDLADAYRQPRKGGWPFSTRDNGYIVSDCSAEALKAVLMLQEECHYDKIISDDRLRDCVDSLLLMQNPDGGFSSYEPTRSSTLLEYLNASEVFDRIMVEYSYPECTTAVVTALSLFSRYFPSYRPTEINGVIERAVRYVTEAQRPDGSWYGSWGVCFTYASFFAMQCLEVVNQTWQTSSEVRKCCKFLLSKQKEDGGWGEHYTSCEQEEYIDHEQSQVVNTAWACLALMHARYPYKEDIEKGLKFIMSRQQRNGEWCQEDVEGVFNNTCMIGYPNYKLYFTAWALGRYDNVYLPMLARERYE
ncbi:terpene synthase [Aspergillus unguis]